MTMTRLLAGIAAIAALASCATAPPVEHFGGAVATIEFLDGDYISDTPNRVNPLLAASYMHHGDDRDQGATRSVEFLSATGASACAPSERIVKFKARTREELMRTVQFQAGLPIGIVARTEGSSRIAAASFSIGTANEIDCRSVGVFTPVAGRTYTVVQNEYRDGRCVLDIRDKETNAAPPNLAVRENISCPGA